MGWGFRVRPFVVDRNIRHFLWYGVGAGEGLRSVGEEALPSSKSVCSILPIVRHLRAGALTSSGPSPYPYSPECVEGDSLLKKSASSRWRPRIGSESPKTGASGVRSGVEAGIKGVFQQAGEFSEVGLQDRA